MIVESCGAEQVSLTGNEVHLYKMLRRDCQLTDYLNI